MRGKGDDAVTGEIERLDILFIGRFAKIERLRRIYVECICH